MIGCCLNVRSQTMNQLLEKVKQGEHVFDVNAEPEPEHEEDHIPDFDADYDEEDCDEGSKEHREGWEASGSGKGRSECYCSTFNKWCLFKGIVHFIIGT